MEKHLRVDRANEKIVIFLKKKEGKTIFFTKKNLSWITRERYL